MPQPLIGIWWDDGTSRAVLSHPLTEQVSGGRLLDSNLTHQAEWSKVRKIFRRDADEEYFSVPRGRVVFDTERERGIIYHGPSTSPERIVEIAKEFQLEEWVARVDEHYCMGDDVDRLFAEDW